MAPDRNKRKDYHYNKLQRKLNEQLKAFQNSEQQDIKPTAEVVPVTNLRELIDTPETTDNQRIISNEYEVNEP